VKLLRSLLKALLGRGPGFLLDGLKTEAAAAYVAGVRKVHQAFVALLALALILLLTLSGFVLIHVALFAWLPWSLTAKALVLLGLGVVYLGAGLAVVLRLSSDRTWMKFTKVDRLLARLSRR